MAMAGIGMKTPSELHFTNSKSTESKNNKSVEQSNNYEYVNQ